MIFPFVSNGKKIEATAKGNILIECFNGSSWLPCKLTNVSFVSELGDFNLFSWGQTISKGYGLKSTPTSTEIHEIKTNKIVIVANRFRNTFKLMIRSSIENNSFALASQLSTLSDWHRRLAHVHVYKILQMSKDGLLPRIKVDYEPSQFFCEGCVKGKMVRKSYKTVKPKAVGVGKSIHCDLQGPIEVFSLIGSDYALVIADEFSSFRRIYTQKYKSDTLKT